MTNTKTKKIINQTTTFYDSFECVVQNSFSNYDGKRVRILTVRKPDRTIYDDKSISQTGGITDKDLLEVDLEGSVDRSNTFFVKPKELGMFRV